MNQYGSFVVKQKGAVLIMGLVLMLLLTIVGMAAVKGSNMQELMVGNMQDRQKGFSSAEAGIRTGENALAAPGFVFNSEVLGFYADLNTPTSVMPQPIRWTKEEWVARALSLNENLIQGAYEPSRYVVEQILAVMPAIETGSARDVESSLASPQIGMYRVTSLGVGTTVDSEVVIQTTYRKN